MPGTKPANSIADLRILRAGRKHVERPRPAILMEHPQFAPALEWLHREHQGPTLGDRLCGRAPHDPIGTTAHQRRVARPMRRPEFHAGLPRIT